MRQELSQEYLLATLDIVRDLTGIPTDTILSRSRQKDCVVARHVAMHLMRSYDASFTLVEIGRMFDRDYTSVIYALRNINTQRQLDPIWTTLVHQAEQAALNNGKIQQISWSAPNH